MIKTRLIPRTEEAYEQPLLIKSILAQTVRYNPEREIIYRDLFTMNYIEFNKRVRRLANLLVASGVQPGDTVAFMDWDSHRFLEAYFAVPSIGAVLHTVNVRLSPSQILYTMNHAEDKLVFVHEDFLPILKALEPQITTVEKYIVLSDHVYTNPSYKIAPPIGNVIGEYEQLLTEQSSEYEFPEFDENSMATIFYTTGTTGDPKGVYFSHRQLYLHTTSLMSYLCGYQVLPFNHEDVYMPLTPMFHVHAWGFPYLVTLLNNKQVYPGRYEPEMLLKLLTTHRVTISHCVPTILSMLVNSPISSVLDLSHWKVVIGGAALTKGLAQAASRLKIQVTQGYGMSETAPVLAVVHLTDQDKQLPEDVIIDYKTTAGKVSPFVELRIVDENNNFLPHDGVTSGELVARGFSLTQGYLKNPKASEVLWRNGWLHTGDVATINEKDCITIVDRTKDIIKTGGEWISSLDIENIISQTEGVAETAVVGLPDSRWGERPHAFIVLKDASAPHIEARIRTRLQCLIDAGDINKWCMPDTITFIDEIPKTSIGKIDKKKLRALAQQ